MPDTDQVTPATATPTLAQEWPVPVGYSVQAAADAFVPPISVQRLRREIKAGALTVRRLGPRAIITRADLEKFAAALPQFIRNRRHD